VQAGALESPRQTTPPLAHSAWPSIISSVTGRLFPLQFIVDYRAGKCLRRLVEGLPSRRV
ncbi:MAG: hypothetical protein ACT60Q_14765, partial [Ferrovibrionaceae bacterium]